METNHKAVYPRKCQLCDLVLKTKDCYYIHKRTKHSSEQPKYSNETLSYPRKCELCGKYFKCHQSFYFHSRSVHKVLRYKKYPAECDTCKKSFENRQKFYKHKLNCNSISQVCEDCNKTFPNKAALKAHFCTKANTANVKKSFSRKTKCFYPECHFYFSHCTKLIKHMENSHFKPLSDTDENPDSPVVVYTEDGTPLQANENIVLIVDDSNI